MNRWLVLTFFLLALPAHAEVYKCRQPGGSIEFSNLPCAGGSSTVKAVADDVIPEEKRRKAERNVEQMREDAEKMEANRRASAEREHQEKQELQRTPSTPSASAIEECLLNVERMALDYSRRTELEANCRASGATTPPVYVPVPYYGGPSYVKPYPPQVNPRPQPRGEAEPLPAPPSSRAAGKINQEYAPPSGFKVR